MLNINNRFIRSIAALQILILITPVAAFSGDPLFDAITKADKDTQAGACPDTKGKDSCTKSCDAYDKEMDKAIAAACPSPEPDPSPGASPIPIHVGDITYSSYDECVNGSGKDSQLGIRARWGVLAQKCDARDMQMQSSMMGVITSSLFTAAAGVCIAACVAESVPALQAAAPSLQVACTVVDLTVAAFDIIETSQLEAANSEHMEWWQYATNEGAVGTAGLGGALSAGGTAEGVVGRKGKFFSKRPGASQSMVKNNAFTSSINKSLQGLAKNNKVISGYQKLSKAAATGKKVASTIGKKIMPCMAAGLLVATAGLKWANYGINCAHAGESCDDIKKMSSLKVGEFVPDQNWGGGGGNNYGDSNNSGDGGSQSSGGATVGDSGMKSLFDEIQTNVGFDQMMRSAATGNPGLTDLNNSLPNMGNSMKDALDKLGTSLSQIGEDLKTKSPTSVISGMIPNLPPDMKAALDDVQKKIDSGQLKLKGDDSGTVMMSGGGGGGGSSSGPRRPAGFGAMAATGSTKTAQVSFNPQPAPKVDNDIWHSNWTGSIFQIISTKLDHTRNRIHELEWSSPLNRALAGLPPKPNDKDSSKKDSNEGKGK
jgi:hypothetical protein